MVNLSVHSRWLAKVHETELKICKFAVQLLDVYILA